MRSISIRCRTVMLLAVMVLLRQEGASWAASHRALAMTTHKAPEKTIRLGFLTSLTGIGLPGGVEMLDGINLYLSQNHHKLGGHNVQLIVEDDESNPSVAAMKVRKMVVTDKIDMLDGVLLSNVGYAISPFIDKYRVPTLLAVCGSDDLTKRRRFNWIVRSGVSSSQSEQAFGTWTAERLPYKRIVAIGMDFEYGYETVGGFQTTFEDGGGQIIQKIWVPLGVSDFSLWTKHIDRHADAIYLAAVQRAAMTLPKQIRKAGIKLPIIASGSTLDQQVLPKLSDECIHSFSAHVYSPTLNRKENACFVAAFRSMYGHSPGFYAESAYTSALWIDKALCAVNGDFADREKVLAALKSIRLTNAPRGLIAVDEFANPIENVYICKLDRVNGHLQNTVVETIPAVSQFWKYKPVAYLKRPSYSRGYPPCRFCATGQP